jgi:hypothetical protein
VVVQEEVNLLVLGILEVLVEAVLFLEQVVQPERELLDKEIMEELELRLQIMAVAVAVARAL